MQKIGDFKDLGIPVRSVVGGGPWAGKDRSGQPCLYAVMGYESNRGDLIILQIDIESGKSLKGGDTTVEDNKPRFFSLQITRKLGS